MSSSRPTSGDEPAGRERRCPACDRPGCRPQYRLSHGAILECQACGSALTHYEQADDYERANARWFGDTRLLINRIYDLPFSRSEARRRVLRLQRHNPELRIGLATAPWPTLGAFLRRLRVPLHRPGLERLLSRSGFRLRESWTHETAVDLLGRRYYAARNWIWSAVKSLAGRGGGPGGPAKASAGVPSAKRALHRIEGTLVLPAACLPGVPIAWLNSRLGSASFVSVIAERRDS